MTFNVLYTTDLWAGVVLLLQVGSVIDIDLSGI